MFAKVVKNLHIYKKYAIFACFILLFFITMKKFCLAISLLVLSIGCAYAQKSTNLFVFGDDVVANGQVADSTIVGWGHFLSNSFASQVNVQLIAHQGASTRTLMIKGDWQASLSQLKKGDVALIHLGFNDANQKDTTAYSSVEAYENNLMLMIQDLQKQKVTPILCTPVAQHYFVDSTLVLRYGAYPEAVRRVAKRMDVDLVDVENLTVEWLNSLGAEVANDYYFFAPEENHSFRLNEKGAQHVAKLVAEQIVKQQLKPLYKFVK